MTRPTALIIGGHPRSGTTMLNALCNNHPDITMTFELKAFAGLWTVKEQYFQRLGDPQRTRPYVKSTDTVIEENQTVSTSFYSQFSREISNRKGLLVKYTDIVAAYQHCFPDKKVVGDKYPQYVFMLRKLTLLPSLRRVIIYRDPRDVIVSTLEKAHGEWKGKAFAEKLNTVEKIAHRWQDAAELMSRYKNAIHAIRYEAIIAEPQKTLAELGEYLGVSPEGFDHTMLKDSSIGRYKNDLTPEDIGMVEKIAGKQMKALGYL